MVKVKSAMDYNPHDQPLPRQYGSYTNYDMDAPQITDLLKFRMKNPPDL